MSQRVYAVPLGEPPELVNVSIGVHGQYPHENYFIADLWCVHLFRDPLKLTVDGHFYEVVPKSITIMPPSVPIHYFFPKPIVHYHICAMFRVRSHSAHATLPAIQDGGEKFESLYNSLEEVLSWHQNRPLRAQARLWEMLWQLTIPSPQERNLHLLVEQAQELIEKRLHQPISVAQLANELDVSHNHLTRCFRASTGTTVVDYLRRQRVKRAEHLLRYTTLPIKTVALQSGLVNFQHLNKATRQILGRSPRAIRDNLQ